MQVWNKSSISQDRGQLLYTCSILLSVVGSASKVQGTMIGLLFLGSEADDCWGEEAFALTTSDELPVGSCVEMLLLENASFISSSKKPSVPKISSPMVVVSSLPQAINPYFWWHSTWKRQATTKLHSGNKGDPLGRLYILPITRFASKWHSEHQRVSRYYFHDHTICRLWIPPDVYRHLILHPPGHLPTHEDYFSSS